MGPRIATIGEIVLDEVVHSGGAAPHRQLGGGALYSAIGALTWAARPEVHAVVGSDAPSAELERLSNAGIDFGHVTRRDGPSLGLWMLYERSGRRQQAPKIDSPTMLEIDHERGPIDLGAAVRGVHIAPQTTEGQRRALDETGGTRTRTLDAMVETYIDLEPYRSGDGLRGISAFLPSEHEVEAIWGPVDHVELARRLFERVGLPWLIITRGSAGVTVVNRDGARHVPALERTIVDPTGAGDAFAGGFLVGLIETGDPLRAALWGTVSASFVVETRGPVAALEQLQRPEVERRLVLLEGRLDAEVKVAHGVEVN
jgi:sugar/nucleoside kinase (ribokinase family)